MNSKELLISITVDPDNMQHSVISHLGLYFSLMSHLHVWNVTYWCVMGCFGSTRGA